MNILQQPDALSFSMNLKKFIVSATGTISFILRLGERELISHKYEPGTDGMVEIDVRDIVHPQLSYIIKDSGEVYRQSNLTADFTAIINTTEIVFRVVRGGVDQLSDSAANFLTQNFLTWQPSVKPVTYYSPEFLTYYAVGVGKIKLRAYFTDDEGNVTTEQEHAIVDIMPGIAYTIPLQYSVVTGWLGNKLPAYYDVWAESTAGHRFTYIQRYYAENMRSAQEQWVLFENSLGGLDTFRAYGSDQFNADHTHNLAETDEVSQEYRVDTERKHQKNTGYLNKEEARWLLDFFPSHKKYLYTGSYLRQIVVMESDVTGKLQKAPLSYTFTYKYADARPLLNLPRTDVPAAVLNITIPEVGSFTVPPRLAEVSRLPLSEGTLFPVQNPYSENWGTTTVGMIGNFISKIFASYNFFKGYFSGESRLLSKYPTGKTGEYAFVGTPWPGTVWEWVDSKWVDTGVTPTLGESVFIELLKRHIDNKTILFDDREKYIYSLGGGGDDVFTITVSMDETQGVHGEILPAAVNTVKRGDSLTLTIKPNPGYVVQRVNVDKVSQGAITEYTFENVQEDHTMYVWFQTEVAANPTDWLERSDLPGTYYSSLQSAFDGLKQTYPEKLTRDVTISCVKESVKFKRDRNLWVAEMAGWNKNSMYVLTIDGANKLTLDCGSLGGISMDHTDNVVIENIVFSNCSNYSESGAPEEVSGVCVTGDVESYCRNVYVRNCTIEGANGRYAVIAKYSDNVYLSHNRITDFNCIPLKIMDCRILSLVKNYVDASHSYGLIGHPALCTISNSRVLIAEDNEFTGTTGEYFFYLTNVEHIFFRRNYFHDGGGEGIKITSKVPVKEMVLESNLFVHLLNQPAVAWAYHYVLFECDAEYVRVLGNTAYINSTWWQQWFMKAQNRHIGTIDLYNNIIVSAVDSSIPMRGIALGKVDTINSGNNLYQVPLQREGVASQGFFSAEGITDSRNLASVQNQGLEIDSHLVATGEKILQVQNGGTLYKLLDILAGTYPADTRHLPDIDYEYKAKAATGNTVGCYNLSGTAIDEAGDTSVGYTGEDISEGVGFSSAAQYVTYADNVLLLKHNSLNRDRFVKMKCTGSRHSSLILGRYGLLNLLPVLDDKGEYVSDELHNINIE